MSIFNDMLKSNESLFKEDITALDYDFMPKLVPYRVSEQKQVALCIKPLFLDRDGRHILIHGRPGVGKTVAVRHLIEELEEDHDEILTVYLNCWQRSSSYKILLDICHQLGYKFTQNKKTDELMDIVAKIANDNKGVVFVFDEVDKVDDLDFMYFILERVLRKSIILITNYKSWLDNLDERIKSRLIPTVLEFREYDPIETEGILKQRRDYSFVQSVWNEDAFKEVVKKTYDIKDIRTGLYLLKEAGQIAEESSKKGIELDDVKGAISKLEHFSSKETKDLSPDEKEILLLIKKNSERKIGDLFKLYSQTHSIIYKTFQRKVKKLENGNYISVKKIVGGSEGKTSIITYGGLKKLTDFNK